MGGISLQRWFCFGVGTKMKLKTAIFEQGSLGVNFRPGQEPGVRVWVPHEKKPGTRNHIHATVVAEKKTNALVCQNKDKHLIALINSNEDNGTIEISALSFTTTQVLI